MAAITATGLAKTYRFHRKEPGLFGSLKSLVRRRTLETRAVDGISFEIEAGEVVGFLGPNGAGKTTTLKMLCGLLYPSAGSATVLGHVPARRDHAYLRQIALVMGNKNVLAWDIPAYETLLLMKEMYSIPTTDFRRRVDELATMLEVEQLMRVQVRKLSLGERMKMELFANLVHQPAVLFLDEPTIGLALTIYAGNRAGVDWDLSGIAAAVAFGICGLSLLYAIWFAIITCSFWLVQISTIDTLFYSFFETARYPISFFSGLARTVLTFVVPVAFATTFPAEALLGRADLRLLLVGAALAVAGLVATHLFWNYAVRHYSSASS